MRSKSLDPDFRILFESAPGLFLVLLPDSPRFTITGVSDAYLKQTATKPQDILGRGLREVFPEHPGDPNAMGRPFTIMQNEGQANLAEKDLELGDLYQRLQLQDRLKTQFFSNVSHELRTPISLILTPIEQLLNRTTDPDTLHSLQLIQRNARLLLGHVNDLIDVADLEAGKFSVEYTKIDLVKLARQIVSNFNPIIEQKGIRLNLELPENLSADVDIEKFGKILSKLFSNAVKFTPAGGMVRCSIQSSGDTKTATFEIADSGPGIPERFRQSIFERFFQIEDTSVRRFGGTGLGLAIVKDLVELHGGNIEVRNAPEGGALLVFSMPLQAPSGRKVKEATPFDYTIRSYTDDLETPAANFPPSKAATQKPLILVVEDNPDMNSLICDILEMNYRVTSALNGKIGLEKALAEKPDLILSDIMMPEMSGDQLFEALKKNADFQGVPFVALTAKADSDLRLRLIRAGADDYMTKPFSADELTARIKNLLAVREISEKLRIELEARNAAEQAVKESEEKFRGILDNAFSGVITVNEQGIIEYANQQMKIFGYEPEELLGKHMEMLIPETLRAGHEAFHSNFKREGMARPMGKRPGIRGRRKDGTEFEVDISLCPFRHKERQIVTVFARDLSDEKRRANQENFLLETSHWQAETVDYQERLQRTVDALVPKIADICSIYVLEEGKLVPKAVAHSTNESDEFIWSIARSGPGLCPPSVGANYVYETGRSQLIEDLNVQVLEKTDFPAEVLQRLTKMKFRSYMAVPLFVRGKILGVMSLARLAPNSFTKNDLDFAEIIGARSALQIDNARLYFEAQASIRLREEILGIVSHDLRSPLATVVMSNQMLAEAAEQMVAEEDKKLIDAPVGIIHRATKQMGRLIGDLLDFARIESGGLSLDLEYVSSGDLIRRGLEMIEHHSRRKDIEFDVQMPSNPPRLACDPDRVTQVFYNLLGNAVKFSPQGSRVKVNVSHESGVLRVEIEDQGRGIPNENLELIFEKYWRVKHDSKEGTGLGLYISRKIIESHGGKLWAEHGASSGAKLIFTLPIKEYSANFTAQKQSV